MQFPAVDPDVEVLAGTDVEAVWDRFEVFEALHHTMTICNPMTGDELDAVVAELGVHERARVLDVACGYGELLLRLATDTAIEGTGIDLSPWMVNSGAARARQHGLGDRLHFVLGEARDFRLPGAAGPDVVACIGAEWIWHDFRGTVRALAERTDPGARVAVGSARLHLDADPAEIAATWGKVETLQDQQQVLESNRFRVRERVDPDDAGWDAYIERTASAVDQWQRTHPGLRAETWQTEQREWHAARERDRNIIGWSVWIAERV